MIRFLKKILTFLLPLIFLTLIFEIYLRNLSTLYHEKTAGLQNRADSIQLLILGNSHACYGVNPNQFDIHGYNMAQPNQSLYFDKRMTLKHLDKLINLKYVLISADLHSLYFSSMGMRDTWSYYAYGIEYENNIDMISKMSRLYGYTPRVAWAFLKKDLQQKDDSLHRYPVDVEDGVSFDPANNGWIYFEGTDQEAISETGCEARAKIFNVTIQNAGEKDRNLADLEDFIMRLKEKNITPILFTTPCYREFNRMVNTEVRNQNKVDIFKLSKTHAVEYWDFTDAPLNKEEFFNCDHLNSAGANKFSALLNERLLTLMKKH